MRLAALYNDYADEDIPDTDLDIPDVDMEEQAGDEPAEEPSGSPSNSPVHPPDIRSRSNYS